jgi:hypothetical protein
MHQQQQTQNTSETVSMSNLHKDDKCNVIQHVDYRSKADLRKKELEDLRKQSITKSKGRFVCSTLTLVKSPKNSGKKYKKNKK